VDEIDVGARRKADLDWLYREGSPSSSTPASPGPSQSDFDWLYKDPAPRHVSDAAPADPPPATPPPPSGKKPATRRRKIVKRSLIALAVVLGLILVVSGFYLWKATKTACNVTNGQDCNMFNVIGAVQQVIGGGAPASAPLATDSNGRTNILLLGTSDDRPDANGDTGPWLTDSIMVVSLSQSAQNAYMISIPRDLWIKYPTPCSNGYQGKINALYQCSGAGFNETTAQYQSAMTATIPVFEDVTGLQIQYAVNLNYSVLTSLVNAVGGSVTVNVTSTDPRGIYDINTGLKLNPNTPQCPSAATQPMICTLDAETALTLARARNSDGGYGLAASNFDREQNQQAIIVGLMHQASSNGFFTNLAGVTTALDGIGSNLRSTFSVANIPSLANLAESIPPANFTSLDFVNATPAIMSTPTLYGQSSVGPIGCSMQNINACFNYSGIQAWIAKNMPANPAVAEGATIDVLNGSGQSGVAASTADELKALGYTIGTIGNYSSKVTSTQVYDITGDKPLTSAALAQKFAVTVTSGTPEGYTPSSKADFVVIVGG